jgi:hypothetical protein
MMMSFLPYVTTCLGFAWVKGRVKGKTEGRLKTRLKARLGDEAEGKAEREAEKARTQQQQTSYDNWGSMPSDI